MRRIFFIITCLLLAGVCSAHAFVMQSDTYFMQIDSIDASGEFQSSASYGIRDSLGDISSGGISGGTYNLDGGYIPMTGEPQDYEISISSPDNLILTPQISGILGGTASGTVSWTVSTNNPTGYYLTVKAATSPALKSGDNFFADYSTVEEGVPDFNWSVPSDQSAFGFTPEGNDIIPKFQDSLGSCVVTEGGNNTEETCWDRFTTNDQSIAFSHVANDPGGVATTLRIQAESGVARAQEAGTYTATITVTALTW